MDKAFRIRELREKRNLSGVYVAEKLDISPQFYYDIEKGKKKLSAENAVKLAEVFGVSVDQVLGMESEAPATTDRYALTAKDEKDIAKLLEEMMEGLNSDASLQFMGEPMSEEERELLRISLENTLRMSKQMAKRKFTPKKYRKEP